jgi:hypothetical protein
MTRHCILRVSAIAALGLALLPSSATGQEQTLKAQLVGTWIFVDSDAKRPDGSPAWGKNAKGLLLFGADGRYTSTIVRSDLPKYASNSRLNTTPAEDKATVQGTVATIGTYTVNEFERSYTIQVEGSTFPNWNGTAQKRTVLTINPDELRTLNNTPSIGGGAAVLLYRRVK